MLAVSTRARECWTVVRVIARTLHSAPIYPGPGRGGRRTVRRAAVVVRARAVTELNRAVAGGAKTGLFCWRSFQTCAVMASGADVGSCFVVDDGSGGVVGGDVGTGSGTVGIKVSAADTRRYRYVELPNRLRVVLVHDPDVPQAAACMNVGVGSGADPRVPVSPDSSDTEVVHGIAHFCEHMLFLGTEAYPDESSYKAFLSKHGGGSNASTSVDHTQYFFHVRHEYLTPALDRFSKFFTCPLFTPSATDRELNAVDSEYNKNLQLDSRRLYQLMRHCSAAGQPFHQFGTGNMHTLKTLPEERGVDVRELLLAFHQRYYSANLMRLSVIGRESLDELEATVRGMFSDVPDTDASVTRPTAHPFTDDSLQQQVWYRPVRDLRSVRIHWRVPTQPTGDLSHSSWLVSHVIGHEGPGSLLSLLRQEGLALGLSCSTHRHPTFSLFFMSIQLTTEGLPRVDDVVRRVYEFIALLTSTLAEAPEKAVDMWHDIKLMHEINFRFREKPKPVSVVKSLARELHYYEAPEVMTGPRLAGDLDLDAVRQLLAMLTPTNMLLTVIGRKTPEGVTINDVEPWYRADYHKQPLSDEQLALWSGIDASAVPSELRFPAKNRFIPTDFRVHHTHKSAATVCSDASCPSRVDLGPDGERGICVHVPATEVPAKLSDSSYARVWHLPDRSFGLPKSALRGHLIAPLATESARSAALAYLYTAVVSEVITEPGYDAALAGYHWSFARRPSSGFGITLRGYSDKLPAVADLLVSVLLYGDNYEAAGGAGARAGPAFACSEEVFSRQREKYVRSLRNHAKEQPYVHCGYGASLALDDSKFSVEQLLAAAEATTCADLQAFAEALFAPAAAGAVAAEVLVAGNARAEDASLLAQAVLTPLCAHTRATATPGTAGAGVGAGVGAGAGAGDGTAPAGAAARPAPGVTLPLAPSGRRHPALMLLPTRAELVLDVGQPNPTDGNCAVQLLFQLGRYTAPTAARAQLLAMLMKEPCFSQLRTREQLGYIVFSGVMVSHNVGFLRLRVQSSHTAGLLLEQRVEAFLANFGPYLRDLSEADFERTKLACARQLVEPPKTAYDAESQVWAVICKEDDYDFGRWHEQAKALVTLTKQELLAWYKATVSTAGPNRRKLTTFLTSSQVADTLVGDGESKQPEGTLTLTVTGVMPAPQVGTESARQHVRLVGGFAVDRWNATAKHADIMQRCSDLSALGGGTRTSSSGGSDTPAGAAVSERLRVLAAAEQDTLTTLHKAVTGRIRRGRDAGHSRL